jgi:hypothetical protein
MDDLKARRRLVSTLTREGGLAATELFSGDYSRSDVERRHRIFRLPPVPVGPIAIQCYASVQDASSMQTGDADFAQDYAISAEVEDSIPLSSMS